MSIVSIVIGVVIVLIFLYLILSYIFKKSTKLTGMNNATEQQEILGSVIPNGSTNYTYSIWFYVDDWSYRFGQTKSVLSRKNNKDPIPVIFFNEIKNDITIEIACYSDNDNMIVHNCVVNNFSLQNWVNLIISLYGRTLDVYIDGKLVKTCMLPGVPKTSTAADNIYITPDGGFKGSTAKIEYWNDSSNPQRAYEIYKEGFGGSVFGSMANKYGVKFSITENNKETSSYEF